MCDHGKTKCDSVGFCSTGILLGCVSIWCSCRFSTFSAAVCPLSTLPLALDVWAWARELRLPTMKTNSALIERSEEDVFDACSEDELPGEQNQWCSLQELWFHDTVGRVLVKALGIDRAMRVSERCMFAIFIAPVDREPQNGCLWCEKKHDMKNSSHDAIFSERQFCIVDACRSPFPDD